MTDFCCRSGVKLIAYGTVAGAFFLTSGSANLNPTFRASKTVLSSNTCWSLRIRSAGRVIRNSSNALLLWANRLGFQLPVCRLYTIGKPEAAAAVVGTRNSRHVADTCRLIGKTFPKTHAEMDEFLKLFPQIEGDCFDIERQPGSRHIAIMRMNLVDSTTGK